MSMFSSSSTPPPGTLDRLTSIAFPQLFFRYGSTKGCCYEYYSDRDRLCKCSRTYECVLIISKEFYTCRLSPTLKENQREMLLQVCDEAGLVTIKLGEGKSPHTVSRIILMLFADLFVKVPGAIYGSL